MNTEERLAELEKEIASIRESLAKDDTIYVPDCIEFYGCCGTLGLKFDGNGLLIWSFVDNRFKVGYYIVYSKIPKLKLTPCEREDLKVGDFAFRTDCKKPDFDCKSQYCLIVNETEYKYIVNDKDVCANENHWENWYKVEVA